MDEENNVPTSTLRVLASLLVLGFDLAREKAADIVDRVRPLVEPPDDLRVHSTAGTLYSGLLIIERGEVVAGIVVMTGQRAVAPSLTTPAPRTAAYGGTTGYSRGEGRLPGWADDPRDDVEEAPPWRRR